MTPQQALISGTKHVAALLGMDSMGAVAKGMAGDLVAVQGHPLADIHVVKQIKVIVNRGKVVVDRRQQKQ